MTPDYVEDGSFRIIDDHENGCCGRLIRIRQYILKENPEDRPSNMDMTIAAHWAMAGFPDDVVFHLGSFFRVTNITREFLGNVDKP